MLWLTLFLYLTTLLTGGHIEENLPNLKTSNLGLLIKSDFKETQTSSTWDDSLSNTGGFWSSLLWNTPFHCSTFKVILHNITYDIVNVNDWA